MAATGQLHGSEWVWPCPYCRADNDLDAMTCLGCGAQLRDPDEDDLFTTVATETAQVVDPTAPRVRESMWSTEVPRPADVLDAEAADVSDPAPPGEDEPGPGAAPAPPGPAAGDSSAQSGAHGTPGARSGPFSASVRTGAREEPGERNGAVFGQPSAPGPSTWTAGGSTPPPPAEPPPAPPPVQEPPTRVPTHGSRTQHPTADSHGLAVAVDRIHEHEREACAAPIAVVGALLRADEVVLGAVAGHLLGHAAVVVLTNSRILVVNSRRWKPLVDEFVPAADLTVHVRHDRDIASLTFVQGDRLTGVDDITDVPGALDLAERVHAMVHGT